ncbi:hypothetical protein OGAPHI_002208 [Ogataea philodendri]|uniref:Transcription factor TFIIIC triple barrel domain-containing protein n=1 Tax=Ogataea philodendri TaxID=1378263 RepID=A0A9P8PBJ9_9ASCO|nr:uncharacterized protein OGAPHI_002208 [Ogataea philodendri]KAH3668454.1 hypothetical protein OGAPHI_002208 [Ogataea philodendri]
MTITTIYIVRHGYRENWLPKEVQRDSPMGDNESDPLLAAHGVEQAVELGQYLSQEVDPKPQLIFSSPFYRCVETIQPTAKELGLSIFLDRGIGEWYRPNRPTIPEPANIAVLSQYFQDLSDKWPPDTVVPSDKGEEEDELMQRCREFWTKFIPKVESQFPKASSIILVTHAAVKIALGMTLLGYTNTREFLKPEHGGDGVSTRIHASTCSLDCYKSSGAGWTMVMNGNTQFLTGGPEMNWHFATAQFEAGNLEYEDVFVTLKFPPNQYISLDRNSLNADSIKKESLEESLEDSAAERSSLRLSGLDKDKPLLQLNNNLYQGEWSKLVGSELVFNENGEFVTKVDGHIVLKSGRLENTENDKESFLAKVLQKARAVKTSNEPDSMDVDS